MASSIGDWLYDAADPDEGWLLGRASSIELSPDGKILASGGWDNVVLLWEVNIPVQGKAVESTGKLPGTWGEVKKTALLQNYPNPFNPETWIPFSLSEPQHVVIRIYNSAGQLVTTSIWDIDRPENT